VLDCGKGEWSSQLPQGFACGHFHIGDPHLTCNCRSATKCVEICVHVMPVSAKECSALSLHELFDFRCEFVVLP
jgi:hypothetical protein